MELDSTTIILLSIVSLGITFGIMYVIIQGATKSRMILKLQRMQVELLTEIALKNGVEAKRIFEIIAKPTLVMY